MQESWLLSGTFIGCADAPPSPEPVETLDEKSAIWESFLCLASIKSEMYDEFYYGLHFKKRDFVVCEYSHEGQYHEEAERLQKCMEEEPKVEEKEMLSFQSALYLSLSASTKNSVSDYRQMFFVARNLTRSAKFMLKYPRPGNIQEKLWIFSVRCQVVIFMQLLEARKKEIEKWQKAIPDYGINIEDSESLEATEEIIHQFLWLYQCHEIWNEANALIATNNADFFAELDDKMGVLTMQSSIRDLVCYVQFGMNKIRALQAELNVSKDR